MPEAKVLSTNPENLKPKAAVIDALQGLANAAPVVMAMEYSGLSANDTAELRKTAREAGVVVRVAKNTLAKKAFADSPYSSMTDDLTGPIMLLFSDAENAAGAASVCKKYAEEHDFLKIRMLSLQGKNLDVSATASIAALPSREVAIARLMGVMLAPVGQLASLLKMTVAQLPLVLGEVRKQKESG